MKTGASGRMRLDRMTCSHSHEEARKGPSVHGIFDLASGEKNATLLMRQNYRFQLLAPPQTRFSAGFGRAIINEQLHYQYLASLQSLRGGVYLKDGAIQPWELKEDGRFPMAGDEQSWHFLLIDENERTIGCARYLVHSSTVPFEMLRIYHSPIMRDERWGEKVRNAVETDLQRARRENLAYVEVGGWALSEEWRGTRAALEILVASYALGHLWGGCLGSCTATVRHNSASILRRIGGSSFSLGGETIPPYKDPRYGCTMELLRFDSRLPAKRFIPLINQLKASVGNLGTIHRSRRQFWDNPERLAPAVHGARLLAEI